MQESCQGRRFTPRRFAGMGPIFYVRCKPKGPFKFVQRIAKGGMSNWPIDAVEALEALTLYRRQNDVLTAQIANEALEKLGSPMRVEPLELANRGLEEIARRWQQHKTCAI